MTDTDGTRNPEIKDKTSVLQNLHPQARTMNLATKDCAIWQEPASVHHRGICETAKAVPKLVRRAKEGFPQEGTVNPHQLLAMAVRMTDGLRLSGSNPDFRKISYRPSLCLSFLLCKIQKIIVLISEWE